MTKPVSPTAAWHLVVMALLVSFAVVINALDPSYEAYYTTFSTLVTLQIVVMALTWTSQLHSNEAWLATLCRATVSPACHKVCTPCTPNAPPVA